MIDIYKVYTSFQKRSLTRTVEILLIYTSKYKFYKKKMVTIVHVRVHARPDGRTQKRPETRTDDIYFYVHGQRIALGDKNIFIPL